MALPSRIVEAIERTRRAGRPRPRAILITPAGQPARDQRTAIAYLAEVGMDLVALVDAADFRTACRMVADGSADRLVVSSLGHVPCLVVVGEAMGGDGVPVRQRRARPVRRTR